MPKPICVPCQRFFRPKKNGFYFIEGKPKGTADGHRVLPGKAEPENWEPYKLWVGDLWECLGCGANIVVGCPGHAVAHDFQPDFKDKIKNFKADQLQVNDC